MNIWTNGCYDILHAGHLSLFEFAKNYKGRRNRLIVGIDSDRRVKELKGGDRPINNQDDRKRMLEALKIVDEVFIYDTAEELESLIMLNGIDYMVIGEEYKDRKVIGRENSKHDVVFFPKDNNSTSNIVEKIKREAKIEVFEKMWLDVQGKNDDISINFNNYAVGNLRKLRI